MIGLLTAAGAVLRDVPIPARYRGEESHLNPVREAPGFAWLLYAAAIRRIWRQYFVNDFNAVSLFLLGGAVGAAVLSMIVLKKCPAGGRLPRVALIAATLLIVMLFLQEISYVPLPIVLNWNLLPGWNGPLGVHVGEILELGFLGVIGWAAWHGKRSDRREPMR